MDEHLRDLGAVPLVRRHREVELYGSDDPRSQARDHDDGASAHAHQARPFSRQNASRIVERERDEEADAGAGVDDGVQHIAQHVDVVIDRRFGSGRLPLLDPNVVRQLHRVDHGRTIAMT